MKLSTRVLFICLGGVLMMAPMWIDYARELKGKNLFLTAEATMWLGGSLLMGVILSFLSRPLLNFSSLNGLLGSHKSQAISLGGLLIIFLGLLIYVNDVILHQFMNSADEHSCFFLAETLRMGKWWVPSHDLSEFFNVTHVGNKEGKWFSVYPPGWPLILALGLKFQIQDFLNPVLSVLSLFFVYLMSHRLWGSKVAFATILVTGLTPFFVFTGASYYSHTSCLLMMSIFSYAFLRWRENEKSLKWAFVIAVSVGYGLATRYLTMASFAAPFLVYSFWPVLTRKVKPRKQHYIIAGILFAFMAVVFLQNFSVSGNMFEAPNKFDKSWERLGFRDFYTPIDALVFIIARVFYLMDWAPPVAIFLYVYVLFVQKTEDVVTKLFRWSFLFPAFAYVFYFSWGGNQYGPRYYYEGFPFFVMTIASGVKYLFEHKSGSVKNFVVGILFVSFVANGFLFYKQGVYFEKVSSQRKALYVEADRVIKNPAIVFIQGMFIGQELVMSRDDAVRNSPTFTQKIIYAKDMGEKNKELMSFFPGREYYTGYYDREALKAILTKL